MCFITRRFLNNGTVQKPRQCLKGGHTSFINL